MLPPQIAWLMDHHPLFSGILSQVCHNGLVGTGTAKGWQILEVNGGELSMYRPCRFPFCWNDLQGTMVYSQGMLLLSLLPRMEFLLILKNYHHGTHKYNSVVYKFISDCPLGTMFRFHILYFPGGLLFPFHSGFPISGGSSNRMVIRGCPF